MDKFMLGCSFKFEAYVKNVSEKVILKVFFKNLLHPIRC